MSLWKKINDGGNVHNILQTQISNLYLYYDLIITNICVCVCIYIYIIKLFIHSWDPELDILYIYKIWSQ